MKQNLQPPATPLEMLSLFFRLSGNIWLVSFKISYLLLTFVL